KGAQETADRKKVTTSKVLGVCVTPAHQLWV
ncbi:unnamed protein product, partial [Diabrotica balteata]